MSFRLRTLFKCVSSLIEGVMCSKITPKSRSPDPSHMTAGDAWIRFFKRRSLASFESAERLIRSEAAVILSFMQSSSIIREGISATSALLLRRNRLSRYGFSLRDKSLPAEPADRRWAGSCPGKGLYPDRPRKPLPISAPLMRRGAGAEWPSFLPGSA